MKIIEKIKNYGILVIRVLLGRKSTKTIGAILIGLGVLFGVSQAKTIAGLIVQAFDESQVVAPDGKRTQSENPTSTPTGIKQTTKAEHGDMLTAAPNLVDLLDESQLIVRGIVSDLSDGLENGVPYTQVTLEVTESLQGHTGKTFTYRQFGLLEPRKMANGKVNLNVTPAGWAKYKQGEDVVLFIGHQASLTGLRTTVGLGQGKLTIHGGNIDSQFGNVGLFENLTIEQGLLNDADKRVLATKKGPVNKDAFLSLVRKAVRNNWVEGGKLRHEKN